ncbi:MAG: hypothetical protein LBE10_02855 [Treponema sp.]|jgi:hypothetical protein|nr:hypothetical protein [Treponema sp.]
MAAIDDFSAEYLLSVSAVTHKTPSQIIGEMVREKPWPHCLDKSIRMDGGRQALCARPRRIFCKVQPKYAYV